MNDSDAPPPRYTMGYDEAFQRFIQSRKAGRCAAYLLPHLEPGMDLLDLGCGPGSISMGLARAIAPGRLAGVDMEESQIGIARQEARKEGVENADFSIGDATRLGFPDGSFDVVHCHALAEHVPDTGALLGEIRRVLRPGGLVGIRDIVGTSCFAHTSHGDLMPMQEAFVRLLEANKGHPQMGIEIKGHLLRSGFLDVRSSFSFDAYDTPEEIDAYLGFILGWFFQDSVRSVLLAHGLAAEEDFPRWRSILEACRADPGDSVFGLCLGEALARAPSA